VCIASATMITPLSTARVTHAGRNITYNGNVTAAGSGGGGRVKTSIPSSLPQQQFPPGGGGGGSVADAPFSSSSSVATMSLGSGGGVGASEKGGGAGDNINQGGGAYNANGGSSGLLLGSESSMALLFPTLPTTTTAPITQATLASMTATTAMAVGGAAHATAGGHRRPSYVPYSSNIGFSGLGGGVTQHYHQNHNHHFHNNSISSGLVRDPHHSQQNQQQHPHPSPCQSSPQLPSSSAGGSGGGVLSTGTSAFQQPLIASPSLSTIPLSGAAVGLSVSSITAFVASIPPMRFHFTTASSVSTPLFGAAPPMMSAMTPMGLAGGRGVVMLCSTPPPPPSLLPSATLPSSPSVLQDVVEPPSPSAPTPVIMSSSREHHHPHHVNVTNAHNNNPAHFSSCTSFYNTSLSAEERVAFGGRRLPDDGMRADRRVGGAEEEQQSEEERSSADDTGNVTEGSTIQSTPSPLPPQKQATNKSAVPPSQQQATAATISSLSAVVMGIGVTVFLAGCCSPLLHATSNSIMAALLLTEDEASKAFSEYNRAVTSYDSAVLGSVDEGSVSISTGGGMGQSAQFRKYRRAVPTVEGDTLGDMVANPASFEVLTAFLSTKTQQQGGGHREQHRGDDDDDSSSSFRRHTSGVTPLRRVSVAFNPPYKTVAGSHFGAEGNDLYRDMAVGEGGGGGADPSDATDKGIIGDDERLFTEAYRTPRGDLVSFEPFTVSLPPLEREVTKYFVCNKTDGEKMCSPSDGIAWCNAQSPFATYTPSTTTAASRRAMTLAARLGGTQCPRGSVCGECSWTERLRSVCFYLSLTDERPLLDRNGLNVPARVAALLNPPSSPASEDDEPTVGVLPKAAGKQAKSDRSDGGEGERTTAEVALDTKTRASASRHLPRKGSKSSSRSIPPPMSSAGSKGVAVEDGNQQRSEEEKPKATQQHDAAKAGSSDEDKYAAFHRLHPHLRETVVKHYHRRYMLSSTDTLGFDYPFHEATYAVPTMAGADDGYNNYDAFSLIAFHLRLDNDPYMAASRLTHGTFKVLEEGRPAPLIIDPKGQSREQLVAAAIKAMEVREKRRLREERRAVAAAAGVGGPTGTDDANGDDDADDGEFSSNHATSAMSFARLVLLLLGGNAFLIGFAMLCLSRFIAAHFGGGEGIGAHGGAIAASAASDAVGGQHQQQQQYRDDDGIEQLGIGLLSDQQQQQQSQQQTQHFVVRGGQSHSRFVAPPSLLKGRLGAASLMASNAANGAAPPKREGNDVNNTSTDAIPESISSTCFGTGAAHQLQHHNNNTAETNVRHYSAALGGCGGDNDGSAQSPEDGSPVEEASHGARGTSRYGLSSAGSPMLN